jgi:hypothetical protein
MQSEDWFEGRFNNREGEAGHEEHVQWGAEEHAQWRAEGEAGRCALIDMPVCVWRCALCLCLTWV